ncbi:hypothetical protein KVT40_009191 [Elsinoe batatas]|uniref:Phosphate transporter n=1 Tax=Elsinoe batatas TaxID=2601811 RepID=A0A8K0KVT5_9PEZI|nr:hypothetical protein KVT40_009191 [Elsinoe batatas]
MAALPQYSYIFGIGIVFAFLDAWNIGANDVANAFATSVSSRSLTLPQAMGIAVVMEFAGAVLAGARTAGTIRNDIIAVEAFEDSPSVLMLGMLCALIGSSLFLTLATKIGLPVSTTYCIIGGIIGVGFATVGASVFAAWGIAPCVAACFGALLFLFTKYGVLRAKNPLRAGMITKGAASLDLDDWGTAPTVGTIFSVAGGVGLLSITFLLSYIHVLLEIIKGPLLLRRPAPPPMPEDVQLVPDYYRGHKTREELEASTSDSNATAEATSDEDSVRNGKAETADEKAPTAVLKPRSPKTPLGKAITRPQGSWLSPMHWLRIINWAFWRGVSVDVVNQQSNTNEAKWLQRFLVGNNLADKHARVKHYDPKVEHLFSFLQVLTAATAAFTHGANDVANAMGPLAAIYSIWQTNVVTDDSEVPIWILVFGGAAISIGCWTYGYNLIRNLGNRITLHSPWRGFCMELGAALTVVMATRLALPVSTTQCIVGTTVGVGLCAGDLKAINWRMVAWSYSGWFITLPCTAVVAGCLMAFVINAPQFGNAL